MNKNDDAAYFISCFFFCFELQSDNALLTPIIIYEMKVIYFHFDHENARNIGNKEPNCTLCSAVCCAPTTFQELTKTEKVIYDLYFFFCFRHA